MPIFSKELDARKAEIEKSPKNNNAPVFDEGNKSKDQNVQSLGRIDDPRNPRFRIQNSNKEKTFNDLVNSAIEQKGNEYKLSEEECNEIRERIYNSVNLGFKDHSIIEDTINQFIKEKYGNEDGNNNINNKLNINNHDKIDKDRAEIENADNDFSLFKDVKNDEISISNNEDNNINFFERENSRQDENGNINSKGSIKSDSKINESRNKIINADNEFSIFNDENNIINSGKGKNLARTDVNNTGHDNSVLSKEKLAEIEGQINNLRKSGGYTEEDLVLLKQNLIEEAIEKKKMDRENLEYQQQVENIIKQSKSENENIEKKYKEAESNLEKMIPNGYRVTSFDKGDGIIGDGNCFYRAIAKLEKGNQEEYGKIRTAISDEINKSAGLAEKSADKIDNNLLTLIQLYAWEYNELKDVEEVNENNLSGVLYQIKEHVKGEDKKNEYAGPIEAYFYAKATKNAVIIYDSIGQMTAFIPDKEGKDMQVKSLSAKETEDQQKIENFVKNNSINVAAAVKLACNTVGPHYEAIVPVDVKN